MGISQTTERLKNRYLRYSFSAVILLLLGQPLMFIIRNHPLEIVYFNPLTGGIKGAVGNYEMDYYFHSTRPASEKLIDHLKKTEEKDVIIGGNFETAWFFRNFPAVTKNIYVPVYIRNSKNWDYYILTAAYMTKYSLRPDNWPPENTVFSIDVDDVPICAVLKRETKNDIKAIELANSGNLDSARVLLEQVISDYPKNLTAHIELGKIYIKMARYLNALNTFRQCLDINPEYEPAFYYLAETQFKSGEKFKAIETLEDLLKINSKYLTGYIKLADYYTDINEFSKAKEVLKKCLKIKPGYKKAVEKLKQLNYK
jgi:tetratricopeptide (TPR) repeat protein